MDQENLVTNSDSEAKSTSVGAHVARFDLIWQQIQKHNAVLFLRHALRVDMTLQQIKDALLYRDLLKHAETIRLTDVLSPAQKSATAGPEGRATTPVRREQLKVSRRKRRGPEEILQLREAVLARMHSAVGSVNTAHLCEVLGNGGFEVDLLQMNRLLNSLESEGYLVCLGGKPKSWRLKPQGRTAPEPMTVVKRAQTP